MITFILILVGGLLIIGLGHLALRALAMTIRYLLPIFMFVFAFILFMPFIGTISTDSTSPETPNRTYSSLDSKDLSNNDLFKYISHDNRESEQSRGRSLLLDLFRTLEQELQSSGNHSGGDLLKYVSQDHRQYQQSHGRSLLLDLLRTLEQELQSSGNHSGDDLLKYVSQDNRSATEANGKYLSADDLRALEQELLSSSSRLRKQYNNPRRQAPTTAGSGFYDSESNDSRESLQLDYNRKNVRQQKSSKNHRQTLQEPNYYSIQIAAGGIQAYVYEEAIKYQELFPQLEVQIYDDPNSSWIKILVGKFTEDELMSYKKKIERRLKQVKELKQGDECHILNHREMDKKLLFSMKG